LKKAHGRTLRPANQRPTYKCCNKLVVLDTCSNYSHQSDHFSNSLPRIMVVLRLRDQEDSCEHTYHKVKGDLHIVVRRFCRNLEKPIGFPVGFKP